MLGNKNYKKSTIINIIGGALIIGIAVYIMLFKKEELKPEGYKAALIILFIVGTITIISNILLYKYIKKNM